MFPHLFTCLPCLLLIAEATSITSVTYTFLLMTEAAPMGLDPTKGTTIQGPFPLLSHGDDTMICPTNTTATALTPEIT